MLRMTRIDPPEDDCAHFLDFTPRGAHQSLTIEEGSRNVMECSINILCEMNPFPPPLSDDMWVRAHTLGFTSGPGVSQAVRESTGNV